MVATVLLQTTRCFCGFSGVNIIPKILFFSGVFVEGINSVLMLPACMIRHV